jgi:hypothetical protein
MNYSNDNVKYADFELMYKHACGCGGYVVPPQTQSQQSQNHEYKLHF